MSAKKLNEKFCPTFCASKLALFCKSTITPLAKVNFLASYQPFKDLYEACDLNSKRKTPNTIYKRSDIETRALIVNDLEEAASQACANNEPLVFDDEKTIRNSLEKAYSNANALYSDDTDNTDLEENACREKQRLKFFTSTHRGRIYEKAIINKLNQEGNFEFLSNKEDLRLVCIDGLFNICGIADGVDVDKNTVIEVKTRRCGSGITLTDEIQALCYLKLYECDTCMLVISDSNGRRVNSRNVLWSENDFNVKIKSKLTEFTNYARNLTKGDFVRLIRLVEEKKCNDHTKKRK